MVNDRKNKKVYILGAGFSGLTLALELTALGFIVEVFDKASDVGGMIQTPRNQFGFYETAANGLRGQKHVLEFFKRHNLNFIECDKRAQKRFIFRDGKSQRWPFGFFETWQLVFSLLKIIIQSPRKTLKPNQSFFDWAKSYFKLVHIQYLFEPALQGIYAGSLKELSSQLILKPLFYKNSKTENQISLVSSKNGLWFLLNEMKNQLIKNNVTFHFNYQDDSALIQSLKKNNSILVLATSAFSAKQYFQDHWQELSIFGESKIHFNFLKEIKANPVISVTVFPEEALSDKYLGFGHLFPRAEKIRALGVLMNDVIFTRSQTSETWIYGGATDQDIINENDENFLNILENDRKLAFNSSEKLKPQQVHITKWPRGFPHYTTHFEKCHTLWVEQKKTVGSPSIFLHGNYTAGLGLTKILLQSEQLAEELSQIC